MVNISFNLRNPNNNSETPLNLIVRWSGRRLVYSTGLKIHPAHWNKNNQRAKATNKFPSHSNFNSTLESLTHEIQKIELSYRSQGRTLTVDSLKGELDQINGRGSVNGIPNDVFSFIDYMIELKSTGKNKHGKSFSKKTIYKYKELRDVLKEFNPRIEFPDFTELTYNKFVQFLEQEKNHAKNTVGKYISVLRAVLNKAQRLGLPVDENGRIAYQTISEVSDSVYLNEQELDDIFNLDLSDNPKLDRVRDIFIIGCWTGLRYSDFIRITKDNIEDEFLTTETVKTDDIVVVPIHPMVRILIEKYNYQFPKPISNQKFNKYIKEVCFLAGIDSSFTKKITRGGAEERTSGEKWQFISSHTCRRTFATNLYKQGFPTLSIMKLTTHKSEKSFLRYIRVTPKEHANMLKDHWSKIITSQKVLNEFKQ